MKTMVGECLGYAVLDCGCTSTVCGKDWLDCYVDTLDLREKNLVREKFKLYSLLLRTKQTSWVNIFIKNPKDKSFLMTIKKQKYIYSNN